MASHQPAPESSFAASATDNPTNLRALPRGGFSMGLSGGFTIPYDSENSGAGFSVENSYDLGPFVSATLGYKWPFGFRFEGELSYQRPNVGDITSVRVAGTRVAIGDGLPATGHANVLALMVNEGFEFLPAKQWTPFLFGGIGAVAFNFSEIEVNRVPLVRDKHWDFVPAFQLGTGIDYSFTENWSGNITYRFFSTMTHADMRAADGTVFESDFSSHIFSLGFRYTF
jgi:opacity protein-like surface antigen